jgi:hypothetical protein
LKAFIEATIAKCGIRTDTLFGFYSDGIPPDEQRAGGFGWGRFPHPEELDFMAQGRAARKTAKKPSSALLYPDEADILLAMRAVHSVVLSLDAKPGPIHDAYQRGGKVVYLTTFDDSGLSLSDFVLKELGARFRDRVQPASPRG